MTPSPRKPAEPHFVRKNTIPMTVKVRKPRKRPVPSDNSLQKCSSTFMSQPLPSESDSNCDVFSQRRNKFRKIKHSPKKKSCWRMGANELSSPTDEDSVLSALYDSPVKSQTSSMCDSSAPCSNLSQPARTLFDNDDDNSEHEDTSMAIFCNDTKGAKGPTDFSHLLDGANENATIAPNKQIKCAIAVELFDSSNAFTAPPVDWRLAHSLRITSQYDSKLSQSINGTYFQCPFLPWLPCFPREFTAVKHDKDARLNIGDWCVQEKIKSLIIAKIVENWTRSLASIFKDLKCVSPVNQYYYVCTPECTILLYNNCGRLGATISPVNKQISNEMKRFGITIDFDTSKSRLSGESATWTGLEIENSNDSASRNSYSQPVKMPSMITNESDDENEDKSSDENDEDSPTKAIEAMNCYTPKTKENMKRRQSFRKSLSKTNIVGKEKNVGFVHVKEDQMNNLMQFISSDRFRPKSGAYQGIPPTILAKNSFEDSTSRSLKVQSNSESKGRSSKWIEFSGGPIFPCDLNAIFRKLKEQNSKFEAHIGGRKYYSEIRPEANVNSYGNEIFAADCVKYEKIKFEKGIFRVE